MNRNLLHRFEHLPKSLQQQVIDFIEFLISKNTPEKKKTKKETSFNFKWQGALKGKYRNTSSVELQHKIWE